MAKLLSKTRTDAQNAIQSDVPINSFEEEIVQWLKTVRFKRQWFGGVSEADVFRRLEELNRMYEAAVLAERVRYDALLEQAGKTEEASHE